MDSKDIQVKEKQEISRPVETTKPGPVYTPAVDIFETDDIISLLADMPGVRPESIQIDLKDNVLTVQGDANPPEEKDEIDVIREYRTGRYFRQFTMPQIIDQSRVEASFADGVLKLVLPKVEPVKPRQISVKTV